MSPTPSYSIVELTQTRDTQQAYHRRCQQLAKAALRDIACRTGQRIEAVELTPTLFVDYVIGKKGRYRANSWRLVRRSVIFTLERAALRGDQAFADEIATATARLRAEKPAPEPNKKPETSRTKAKSVADDDWARIEHAALAKRAPSATDLVCYLKAAVVTGLRPCEWPRAQLHQSSREGFSWMLVVDNAKATNGRGNGPTRTLFWKSLDPDVISNIRVWIEIAQSDGYERRLGTIRPAAVGDHSRALAASCEMADFVLDPSCRYHRLEVVLLARWPKRRGTPGSSRDHRSPRGSWKR